MNLQEPLNIELLGQLAAYLERIGRITPNEAIVARKLTGGVSNRTVLVKRPNGEAWVLKQALAQLRVQVPWFSDPNRIHREARGLRWLQKLAPAGHIPAFLFEDHEYHVLGMAAVPEPHQNWKVMLLGGQICRDHVLQFGQLLGDIHRRAYEERSAVAPAFADRSFFESLRLEPYYAYTAEQIPEAADFLYALITDVRRQALSLVHGDYSPKNILIHQDNLFLLDHEVIHYGDPAFDIGFSMTHFLSKAHHLPFYRADFIEAARKYWQTYWGRLGNVTWRNGLEVRAVRHTLGCILARVAGRSTLEYLTIEEHYRQQEVAVRLMKTPPPSMLALIDQFTGNL